MLRYLIYILYFCGDSILATKTGMVTFFGEFALVITKMFYKQARPYWVDKDIDVYKCMNDFEGPSDHIFVLTFLPTYINLIYFRKYARKTEHGKSTLCFIV